MPIHTDSVIRTRLKANQSLRLHAATGTSFIVTKGTVSIAEAPAWLCDQFLQERSVLRDGEHYVVRSAGWILVAAHEATEVICQPSGNPAWHGRICASIAVQLSQTWRNLLRN